MYSTTSSITTLSPVLYSSRHRNSVKIRFRAVSAEAITKAAVKPAAKATVKKGGPLRTIRNSYKWFTRQTSKLVDALAKAAREAEARRKADDAKLREAAAIRLKKEQEAEHM